MNLEKDYRTAEQLLLSKEQEIIDLTGELTDGVSPMHSQVSLPVHSLTAY